MMWGRLRSGTDRDASRADWMELFFDLVFVALIGQLAAGLRTDPSFGEILKFLALFASVWWSWVNLTYTVNVQLGMSRRTLAGYMLAAMAAVGAIAVAAPEAVGGRAWLFALGNAGLRCVMLVLWTRRSWTTSVASRVRLLSYNGATAAIWAASAFLPAPVDYAFWAVAILCEVVLLVASAPGLLRRVNTLNADHLADRFGTLVIIALGESVLAVVLTLSGAMTPIAAVTAGLGLIVTAGIAWSMFMFGIDAMRDGLESLAARDDSRGIVETFAFLPYFLVAGVMLLAGALSTAVRAPLIPLPPAAAVSLGAGVALAYAANALISARYGVRARFVLSWALPAVLLPLASIPLALTLPAAEAVGGMAVVLLAIVLIAEALARRSHAAGTTEGRR
ncbi:low temperature requirement protein A [Microbacterium capsulatum]|uniref:Low temperature requirement protein A n=1 Tax=Microbacterium capsulatum TaxID=3041921 RepID=A0ABU0XCZ1_9MICO|nr:low temperature requirement protein A [Microbacterium sp. ASV81]MDQ4212478.1 low temperature requirement protein A [Microbacterium sp. ASV81]